MSKMLLMVTQLLQNDLYLDHSASSRGDGGVKDVADGDPCCCRMIFTWIILPTAEEMAVSKMLLMVTQLLQNDLYLDHSAHGRGDGGVKDVAEGDPVVAE